jgi:uncharacterized protein (DUF169 family)
MASLSEFSKEIEEHLRLKTLPLAIKMLEDEHDIPEGSIRPRRNLRHCLSTCQAFGMSRRSGKSLVMLKEDMWCIEPVIGYGLVSPPQSFLQGDNRYPRDVASREAGAHWASEEFPRFEPGKYVGIAVAPLGTANFEPDVTIIYSNTYQLTILLYGMAYRYGADLPTTLSPHADCVYSVVCPLQQHKCWVTLPCVGDRRWAMAGDDEVIFSVPANEMNDLMEGLRYVRKAGRKVPLEIPMIPEYPPTPEYAKIAKLIGMTKADGSSPL